MISVDLGGKRTVYVKRTDYIANSVHITCTTLRTTLRTRSALGDMRILHRAISYHYSPLLECTGGTVRIGPLI